nr:immunoglobulin light chain junction region [Macaca mulatta]
CYQRSSGYSF